MILFSLSGFAIPENVVDYVQNREKFTKKKRCKEFVYAVQQIEDFIRDPIVRILIIIPFNLTFYMLYFIHISEFYFKF